MNSEKKHKKKNKYISQVAHHFKLHQFLNILTNVYILLTSCLKMRKNTWSNNIFFYNVLSLIILNIKYFSKNYKIYKCGPKIIHDYKRVEISSSKTKEKISMGRCMLKYQIITNKLIIHDHTYNWCIKGIKSTCNTIK